MPTLTPRPNASRRRRFALLAAPVAALGLGLVATSADAADITSRASLSTTLVTDGVTTDPNGQPTYWDWQRATMRITWAVPNGTHAGDTFVVPIDPALQAASFIPFNLLAPDGAVVARASVSGTNLVFTLTSYVDTHTDVHGDATLQLEFNTDHLSTTVPSVVDVYGTRVTVKRDPGPTGKWNYKYGWWQPTEAAATARDEDGALIQRDRPQVRWAIQLKTRVGDPARDWRTLTVTETPEPGTHFVCTRGADGTYTGLRPRIGVTQLGSGGPPAVAVVSCDSSRLVLRITKELTDAGVYNVAFDGWLDTDDAGRPVYRDTGGNTHVGFNPNGYGNTAALDYDGWVEDVSRVFTRTDQRGTGVGTGLGPAIDIEKYTGPWSGVTFRGGIPVLDESGQPANLPSGDADGAPGVAVPAGVATPITITVTNTGNETLNDVRVTDAGGAPGDLGDMTCSLRGMTRMPFNGLAPGQSFTCTMTLRAGFTSPHRDEAAVTAVGAISGRQVGDRDAFNATTPAVPPAVTPPVVTPPVVTPPVIGTGTPAPTPRLRITKVPVSRAAWAGGRMTWRIVVRNTGRDTARPVTVCDLPRGAGFTTPVVRYRTGGAWVTTRMVMRSGRGCIVVPALAPGRSVVWDVTTRVPRSARGTLTNTATAATPGAPRVHAVAHRRVRALPEANVPAVTG